MKMSLPIQRHFAFTLIELLVVIAIIAILAAILFPVFAQAREKARTISCLSNLKQLALAFQMYDQDYDEVFPNARNGVEGATQTGGWVYFSRYPANDISKGTKAFDASQSSLYPYIKNGGIFVCPSDSIGHSSGNSYGANSCIFQTNDDTLGLAKGKSLSTFETPTDFMLIGEEAVPNDGNLSSGDFLKSSSSDDGYLLRGPNFFSIRHSQGSNIAFVDGHTKWFRAETIVANKYQTGGKDTTDCP